MVHAESLHNSESSKIFRQSFTLIENTWIFYCMELISPVQDYADVYKLRVSCFSPDLKARGIFTSSHSERFQSSHEHIYEIYWNNMLLDSSSSSSSVCSSLRASASTPASAPMYCNINYFVQCVCFHD